MTLIICICDFWHHKQYYKLEAPKSNVYQNNGLYSLEVLLNINTKKSQNAGEPVLRGSVKRLKLDIDGICFFYLHKELLKFTDYRRVLCTHPALKRVQLLWLQIVRPSREIIDWKWNRMLAVKLWEKIETDYLMSWLSTLGGGFSALGEQFSNCAEMAGKISEKQLLIGIQLGDPFLQSRCKLFYSISLIQTGHLRKAKYIIRKQYAFARCHEEVDARLVKMCKGIWLRLQYEYGLRLKARKREHEILKVDGEGDK